MQCNEDVWENGSMAPLNITLSIRWRKIISFYLTYWVGARAVLDTVHYKRETRNKNLVVSPRWVLYFKTDWPTDRRS
jgi:hypothetical protein